MININKQLSPQHLTPLCESLTSLCKIWRKESEFHRTMLTPSNDAERFHTKVSLQDQSAILQRERSSLTESVSRHVNTFVFNCVCKRTLERVRRCRDETFWRTDERRKGQLSTACYFCLRARSLTSWRERSKCHLWSSLYWRANFLSPR